MVKTYKDISQAVQKKVKNATLSSMLDFIKKKKLKLWGLEKGRLFLKKQLVLMLYKDINAVGYTSLSQETKNWNKITAKSLNKNTKKIRKALAEWGKSHITPGDSSGWDKAKRNCDLGELVKNTQLWIDSTDYPLKGRYFVSKRILLGFTS